MRESIGGTWLLGFVVLFIVLFSAFLAVSINYTKAFKTKNQIINIIEQNEGFRTTQFSNLSGTIKSDLEKSEMTEDQIYLYISNVGYASSTISDDVCDGKGEFYTGGYCVLKKCSNLGVYYKVTTFVKIELPLLWQSFTVPITGETKTIYYDYSDVDCG